MFAVIERTRSGISSADSCAASWRFSEVARCNLHGRKSLSQFRSDAAGRPFSPFLSLPFFIAIVHPPGIRGLESRRRRRRRRRCRCRPSTPCHPIAAGYARLAERCIDCRVSAPHESASKAAPSRTGDDTPGG